jgi:Na+-transporting methylmalonyl-CoA/oxaloacetate decarboxylase gamma subunit
MDEGDTAQFYLFCVLCGIVILLLIILACVLNCKIRRIDKLINEEKKKDKVL